MSLETVEGNTVAKRFEKVPGAYSCNRHEMIGHTAPQSPPPECASL